MSRSTAKPPGKFAALGLALILAAAVALLLAACGSSDPTAGAQGSQASTDSSDYIVPSSNPISSGNEPSVARYPNGRDNDELSETGADPVNPCRLVSRSEATAILGGDVRTSVGPQGPTCIYAPERSAPQITLVIEQTSFSRLRRRASRATRMWVGSRSGWCLRFSSPSVAVPLAGGSVLNVNGPCGVAARFAALAVSEGSAQQSRPRPATQ
jgi:hypothetical protein